MPIQLTASTASDTYSTRDDIEGIYGTDDVEAYADLNSNGDADEIATQIARARQHAYDWINSKLRGAGLTAPATEDGFTEFGLLDDIEAERAGAWLYFHRGKNDLGADADGKMQWHWDNAAAELDRIIAIGVAADDDDATATPGTFQFIPIDRGTTCDDGDEYAS